LVTSERPTGERYSSPMVRMLAYGQGSQARLPPRQQGGLRQQDQKEIPEETAHGHFRDAGRLTFPFFLPAPEGKHERVKRTICMD